MFPFRQQQNVPSNDGKKTSSRRERDKRRERPDRKSESSHDGGESKENKEAHLDPMEEPSKEGETKPGLDSKSSGLKKRGGEGELFLFFSPLSLRCMCTLGRYCAKSVC